MPPWAIPTTISKAWACLRTNTFVHRSNGRTTNARVDLMAPRRRIVAWPAHLVFQLTRAQQSKRPKRWMEVSSFAHRETALLLQAAYSDYQLGAFENFHQPVEDTLIVLRLGPKVFFQYQLRFVNCLKSQLLIGHLFLPIKIVDQSPLLTHQTNAAQTTEGARNQANFGKYPRSLELSHQFLFQCGSPRRTIAAASWFNTASDVDAYMAATESRATCL
jgi:hypothetical protein